MAGDWMKHMGHPEISGVCSDPIFADEPFRQQWLSRLLRDAKSPTSLLLRKYSGHPSL